MVCDHIEIAEEGRTCEICSVQLDEGQLCSSCTRTMNDLHSLQASPGYGNSLVHVLTSLQKWARDISAWDLIQGVDVLMKLINQRFVRPEQHRIAPFIVLEGPDFSGNAFHAEAISLWLTRQGFAVQTLTFPNSQTPLGRFLKRALKEQVPLSMWTHHVLFSLHRWEFASWITDALSRNYALVVERYAWSGTTYSWASDPKASPSKHMLLDARLPQPDLVICLVTPFSDVISRGGVPPSMFIDVDFQRQLRLCYADPRIWKGINVVMHETQLNQMGFKKNFDKKRIQGEAIIAPEPETVVLFMGTIRYLSNMSYGFSIESTVVSVLWMRRSHSLWLLDGKFGFCENSHLLCLCIRIWGLGGRTCT